MWRFSAPSCSLELCLPGLNLFAQTSEKKKSVNGNLFFADAWTESNDTSSIQTSRLETLRLAVMLVAPGAQPTC